MSESKNQLSFPNRKPFSRHLGLVIILAAFAGLGILYDVTVPFFEKADELKHFAVIQHIQTRRQLPVVKEGVYEAWAQEGTQPPLYYILAAIATAWADLSDFEEPPRNPHYPFQRSFIWRELGNNNLCLHTVVETWRTDPVCPPAFPTAFWQSGNTFIDTRQLSLPANLSPGNYTLQIGWYNLDTLARLSFTTESQSGDALQLLAISVVE